MRRALLLASLLIPLGGCYVPPQGPAYGYAQPGYPPAGYAPSGYPPPPGYAPGSYAPAPYDPDAGGYPGYSYNDGAPTMLEGGIAVPLVLYGGEWGYYDRDRQWHRAPEGVRRDLDVRRGAGQSRPGAPRGEGYPEPRPGQAGGQPGYRPGEPPRPGAAGGQPGYRPAEQPRPPQAAPVRQGGEQAGRDRSHDCAPGQHC